MKRDHVFETPAPDIDLKTFKKLLAKRRKARNLYFEEQEDQDYKEPHEVFNKNSIAQDDRKNSCIPEQPQSLKHSKQEKLESLRSQKAALVGNLADKDHQKSELEAERETQLAKIREVQTQLELLNKAKHQLVQRLKQALLSEGTVRRTSSSNFTMQPATTPVALVRPMPVTPTAASHAPLIGSHMPPPTTPSALWPTPSVPSQPIAVQAATTPTALPRPSTSPFCTSPVPMPFPALASTPSRTGPPPTSPLIAPLSLSTSLSHSSSLPRETSLPLPFASPQPSATARSSSTPDLPLATSTDSRSPAPGQSQPADPLPTVKTEEFSNASSPAHVSVPSPRKAAPKVAVGNPKPSKRKPDGDVEDIEEGECEEGEEGECPASPGRELPTASVAAPSPRPAPPSLPTASSSAVPERSVLDRMDRERERSERDRIDRPPQASPPRAAPIPAPTPPHVAPPPASRLPPHLAQGPPPGISPRPSPGWSGPPHSAGPFPSGQGPQSHHLPPHLVPGGPMHRPPHGMHDMQRMPPPYGGMRGPRPMHMMPPPPPGRGRGWHMYPGQPPPPSLNRRGSWGS